MTYLSTTRDNSKLRHGIKGKVRVHTPTISFMSFYEPKLPGFCEWWYFGGRAPEYANTGTAIATIPLVIYYLFQLQHRNVLHDATLAYLLLNGFASATFHYTLFSLPGGFDTFTMTSTVCFLLLSVLQINAYHAPTFGWTLSIILCAGCWSLLGVLGSWPNTGIDYTFIFVAFVFLILVCLAYQDAWEGNFPRRKRARLAVLLFLGGATGWGMTEPWCGTIPALRSFFFFHGIWHLTSAGSVCVLVTVLDERLEEVTKILPTFIPPSPLSLEDVQTLYDQTESSSNTI